MNHQEKMPAKHSCHAVSSGTFYPPETATGIDVENVECHQVTWIEDFCECLQVIWMDVVESDHAAKEFFLFDARQQPELLQGLMSVLILVRQQDPSHDLSG